MPDQKRLEMIAEIARLYYEEKHNLKEIGRIFDISSSSVSRLIHEAHDLKIVQVVIRYPFLTDPTLGKQLQQHLALKDVYVLSDFQGPYQEMVNRVGRLAARVLEERLSDDMTLGISLGNAVAITARAFVMAQPIRGLVIRLQGANENEIMEGTDLAQIFSRQLSNEFKIIPSPWIMQNRETCDLILLEPTVKEAIRMAECSDIALVGIGTLDPSLSTLLNNKLISLDELNELKAAGAAGEICGKYFDSHGNVMDVEFNHRSVSIAIEKLRDIETVIGVAAGSAKVDSILGAIRGHLINVLVTNAEAARLLLERDNV